MTADVGGTAPRVMKTRGATMLASEILDGAMQRAIELAHRGPLNDPNPRVGCVLLDAAGRIVAEGWHGGSGTPHAEIEALRALPPEWRGRTGELTAVVTLEPCNHTGRTGPCAEALVAAGIGALAYAVTDPGENSGGGAETLRAAGIPVVGGVCADAGLALIEPWLARRAAQLPRPHVTVKWAQTLDGRAAAADGSSQWITGPDARGDVHRRRAEADAILVGTGTLLADNPALTARAEMGGLLVPPAEQPVPVVLGHREIPADARIREHPALAGRGLAGPIRLTGDDLAADLAALHGMGIRRLFIEGGPAVASSFIAADLVDELLVYVAPALLGGPRLALGDLGIGSMAGMRRLRITHFAQLGADLLIKASLKPRPDGGPEADGGPQPTGEPHAAPDPYPRTTHTPEEHP